MIVNHRKPTVLITVGFWYVPLALWRTSAYNMLMNVKSVMELSKEYKIPDRTIFGWYERKLIEGVKIGNSVAINVDSFLEHIKSKRKKRAK